MERSGTSQWRVNGPRVRARRLAAPDAPFEDGRSPLGRPVGVGVVLLGLLAVAPVSSGQAAPLPPGAGTSHIISPGDGTLQRGEAVKLAVRIRPGVRVKGFLDGREVKLRRGARPRVVQARLSRRSLRPGTHAFGVRSRRAGKRVDRDDVRFVVAGERRRGLVSLKAPRRAAAGSPLRAAVRLREPHRMRLRARLNGVRVDSRFKVERGQTHVASLSASDGLRFGRNRLRVLAFDLDGTHHQISRTIRVPRSRPLAGGGRDRAVFAGRRVRLNAGRSRPAGRSSRLSYRWEVVRAPRGSSPALSSARSARPSLRTDLHGTYRVRLTLTERPRGRGRTLLAASSSSDVIEVSASPEVPPLGVPIEINVAGQGSIAIDYPGDDQPTVIPMESAQYTVMVIDRQTLNILDGGIQTVHEGDEGAFRDGPLERYEGDPTKMFVVACGCNSPFATPDLKNLNELLGAIGANPIATTSVLPGFMLAAIGIPGTKPGQAYQNVTLVEAGEGEISLAGRLTRDTAGADLDPTTPSSATTATPAAASATTLSTSYTFAPTEYVPYSLDPDGSRVTLGCTQQTTYCEEETLDPPGGPGFSVAVFDARTLESEGSQSFSAESSVQDSQMAEMAVFLEPYASADLNVNEDFLIFVWSVGGPAPSSPSWGSVGAQIRSLGGNIHNFNTFNPANQASGPANYAVVGGPGVEAQQFVGGSAETPLQMSGILARGNNWLFAPQVSDPLGAFDFSLLEIAYQPTTPDSDFPLSGGNYSAIEAYVADVVFCPQPQPQSCTAPGDIRSQYWKQNWDWAASASSLEALDYPTHTVEITGNPTGGTFTLSWQGDETEPIPYDATATEVQWALSKLSSEVSDPDLNSARVGGGPGPDAPFLVDLSAAGDGTLSADGSALVPSGAVSIAPRTSQFSPQEFGALKQQLVGTEWPVLATVANFLSAPDGAGQLYQTFVSSAGRNYVDVGGPNGIAAQVEKAVSPSNASTTTKILETFEDVFWIASSAAGFFRRNDARPASKPERSPVPTTPTTSAKVGAGLGGIAAVFALASVWVDDGSGTRLMQEIDVQAQEVETQLAQWVPAAQQGLENLRQVLVSDYAKLTATADFASDVEVAESASEYLTISARRLAYRTLIPIKAPINCWDFSVDPSENRFNAVVGFELHDGQVTPQINALENSSVDLSASAMRALFASATIGSSDLNAGWTPSVFWIDEYLPKARLNGLFPNHCPGLIASRREP